MHGYRKVGDQTVEDALTDAVVAGRDDGQHRVPRLPLMIFSWWTRTTGGLTIPPVFSDKQEDTSSNKGKHCICQPWAFR